MSKNILIVDDSAAMRRIVMRGIRQAGIGDTEFQEAADGVEGLEALASGSFDLVLSDVNMPNMNGLDFVKLAIDQHDSTPPVVMITTEGSDEVVREAADRGASGCLKKPFTLSDIQKALGPFLE